jgi:high-affinity nickel permease
VILTKEQAKVKRNVTIAMFVVVLAYRLGGLALFAVLVTETTKRVAVWCHAYSVNPYEPVNGLQYAVIGFIVFCIYLFVGSIVVWFVKNSWKKAKNYWSDNEYRFIK